MSGTQVHPFFILFAEFSGRHFYQMSRAEWMFWEAQGILAHLTFRSLMSMKSEDDPVSYVQAHWSMATGLMSAGSPILARRHYQMAARAIKEHNVRFVKPCPRSNPDPSVQFTEQDHERAALLGKIIHFESFLSLYLTGLPGARSWDDDKEAALSVSPNTSYVQEFTQPRNHQESAESILREIQSLIPDLERQFRQELPVRPPQRLEKHYRLQDNQLAFPVLFKICPLILRTKTFLLCKDVRTCLYHLQSREYHTNITNALSHHPQSDSESRNRRIRAGSHQRAPKSLAGCSRSYE
jgi:hypothetical protein